MQKGTDKTLFAVNSDIICLLKVTLEIGWVEVKELSIYRMLYLSAVLYSFRFANQLNPFLENYHFVVNYRGPYDETIEKSLIFLRARDYIDFNTSNKTYSLTGEAGKISTEGLEGFETKQEWFETIVHLLSIHGVDKIYEFVIRDPEYQENVQINATKDINLSLTNRTIQFLNAFKSDFEKTLGKQADQIDEKEYLQLYFEYIFSKIAKGDIEL